MGVESTYLQGSTFWFILPIEQVHDGPDTAGKLVVDWPVVSLNETERLIVVVHEDNQVPKIIQRHLSNYQVIQATDIETGLALSQEVKPVALVIGASDPWSPLQNGTDYLFVQSPLPDRWSIARELGAVDYLVKPVSKETLLGAISRLGRPVSRVVVADDDPQVVRLFRRVLSSIVPENQCLAAYNGVDALRLIEAHRPDLVLLDLVMPEMGGEEVLAHLADEPELQDIPTIVISGAGPDQLGRPIPGDIVFSKTGGFSFGEVICGLEGALNALTPSWDNLSSRERGLPEETAV
jgi:CheY-like chemotaxis protein